MTNEPMASESFQPPCTRRNGPFFLVQREASSSPIDAGSANNHDSGNASAKADSSQSSFVEVALPLNGPKPAKPSFNSNLTTVHDASPSHSSSKPCVNEDHYAGNSQSVIVDHNGKKPADSEKSSASDLVRTANESGHSTIAQLSNSSVSELEALKKALELANTRIAAMDSELAQQRITSQSINNVLQSPSVMNVQPRASVETVNNQLVPVPSSNGSSSNCSYSGDQFQGPWNNAKTGSVPFANLSLNATSSGPASSGWNANGASTWASFDPRNMAKTANVPSAPQPQRPGNLRVDTWTANQHYNAGFEDQAFDQINRRAYPPGYRPGSAMGGMYQSASSYVGSVPSTPLGFSPPLTPMQMQQMNVMPNVPNAYGPRSVGNGLSPVALEFNNGGTYNMNSSVVPNNWANPNGATESVSGFVQAGEPTNYRKLLDRNMSCNWKYIVDKIVCSNDQQASIFLQQKLKLSGNEQKYELIEAIIAQAYPLMINRFGNFLVQRCFEHGTPDQVIAIANAIRGNTLNLSMDPFGCHVVQKAFDVVPEEYKAMMVHELLCRIPETVIHRYACHVWQKLFELRWSDSPPQIMKYVNEALRGMWHEVALGETGSLVVQNIFENCLDEDKRPCVNEVLASIDIIAHGQFGNWCIQHICEHGLPADKSRAIEHVLRYATDYSVDQFASKVVEKCLKVAGPEFTERYLERVCEGRPDRPRMPLIDIAGDQYGNYLIQYILVNGNTQHRETAATHIRKHMVSLRGSKFGSRVAMLCSNPASATRPGPPAGMQPNNRYMHSAGMGRGSMNGPYR